MSGKGKTVGVLALQGGFAKHLDALHRLGVEARIVRTVDEIERIDGLVIPGGESTTMTRLIEVQEMEDALREFCTEKPVFGTCAGMVLLSTTNGSDDVLRLGAIDIKVERNAYGRQVHSFSAELSLDFTNGSPFHSVFIRAPRVIHIGDGVVPLASLDGEVVMARNSNVLVSSFHPELTDNMAVHQYFVESILD